MVTEDHCSKCGCNAYDQCDNPCCPHHDPVKKPRWPRKLPDAIGTPLPQKEKK